MVTQLPCIIISVLSLFLGRIIAQEAPEPGTNKTGPLSTYKSRPEIYAPFLNVTIFDEAAVTPGLIFLAPYQSLQDAIYIYDNYGNLVYSGYGQTGGGPSHNFHVASIGGNDRLVYFTGAQGEGYGRGFVTIMDDTLAGINTVRVQNGRTALDEHEFNVVDDGKSALVTTYYPERADLSAYNVTSGQGWVMTGIFQKVDISTNELQFEWIASDFVALSETYVGINDSEVAGTGLTPESPWDYFHINSVDQTSNGDFIVSARHTSTIYRISAVDGHIIWRLGGKVSDFSFAPGVNFSFQHDARVRQENASTMILSLFDNAANGYANQSSRYSSGMILKLDFTVQPHAVTLMSRFISPYEFISQSQGNVQLLPAHYNTSQRDDWPTANAFLGWGKNAWVSEYTPGNPGRIVQQAYFATEGAMHYRAYKQNITLNPPDAPALYTYAASNDTGSEASVSTAFYMSWNGATRVTNWRVYGRHGANDSWTVLGTTQKTGFETYFSAQGYWAYGMVEALEDDTGLKNSSARYGGVRTFVPGVALAPVCGTTGCSSSDASTTNTSQAPSSATTSSAAKRLAVASFPGGGGGVMDYVGTKLGVSLTSTVGVLIGLGTLMIALL